MIIADLHIHSKYSRATSRDCEPENLDLWARRKGIKLLGTGDFTHPAWREELHEKLVPAGEGLYQLKEELRQADCVAGEPIIPRFVLTGEISSIYKKNGKTRKVHNVILLPSLEAAETVSKKLEAIGNLHSDGRPILGLDSRDLLEITLEACPEAIFIPAHIWTPHFSVFGAFSAFETMEECFGDLTPYIHAVETGLSSDPPMNWRVSSLDRYTLVSNSDAHSPAKLGREANLLNIQEPLSYSALADAIQGRRPETFQGTIEFFPEEGKYHLDGHRNCNLCLKPSETKKYQGICPVCGKKMTIGVQNRVEQLADRAEGETRPNGKPFESLSPLPEVIAACIGSSAGGTVVNRQYMSMLKDLGNEFYILREAPIEQIEGDAGPCIAEGIRRLRRGEVERIPGYDGEYGVIQLLSSDEIQSLNGQTSLFSMETLSDKREREQGKIVPKVSEMETVQALEKTLNIDLSESLNQEQQIAVEALEPVIAVIAGPGTGKTKTLVSRIAHLIKNRGVKPSQITAVTFTNKATDEMRQRLEQKFGGRKAVKGMTIGTFHAICLQRLSQDRTIHLIDESAALEMAERVLKEMECKGSPQKFLEWVSKRKNGLSGQEGNFPEEAFEKYQEQLHQFGGLDFDDLLLEELEQWKIPNQTKGKANPFAYLLVDEFQDINPIQYQLIQKWAQGGKGLFVIGDPDQSIYGFRGADAECFMHLGRDYPNLRTIQLVKNYRCTPEILSYALSAISSNSGVERLLEAQKPNGMPVRQAETTGELSEGIFIAKEINKMVGGIDMLETERHDIVQRENLRDFSDIAILYRTHRQSDMLERCLKKEGIPYVVAGRDDYLADKKVRGTIDFFRFLGNPLEYSALDGCLCKLWGCPADIILVLGAEMESICGKEGILDGDKIDRLLKGFSEYPLLNGFLCAVQEFLPLCLRGKPWKILESFAKKVGIESEPLKKLTYTAVFYKNMDEFLKALALGQESDLIRSAAGKRYDAGTVTLMSLHGAKGLEYPVVFLSGVKKGILPLQSERKEIDIEEERRLFYVGITRAKEELIIVTGKEKSPFLEEIPGELFQKEETVKSSGRNNAEIQLSFF